MILGIILGSILLAIAAGGMGGVSYLQKNALIGDVIAHAIFPGIALGFLVSGTKHPFFIVLGASVVGLLAIYAIQGIRNTTKIKNDTALAIVLSSFFGLGVVLFTFIQQNFSASQTGLDRFLFGKIASMMDQDLYGLLVLCSLVIVALYVLWRPIYMVLFDKDFARSIGIKVFWIESLLSFLTVLVIVSGIQLVGVILVSALLITPATAARFWTHRFPTFLCFSAAIGVVGSLLGVWISSTFEKTPTGPWIVIFLSFLAGASFFFAPQRGILSKRSRKIKTKTQIRKDHILKWMYQKSQSLSKTGPWSQEEVIHAIGGKPSHMRDAIRDLEKSSLVRLDELSITATPQGLDRGRRIVKIHRLWELYLTNRLNFPSDHVHHDADTVEHFIDESMEKELEEFLDYPERDPHNQEIPYYRHVDR